MIEDVNVEVLYVSEDKKMKEWMEVEIGKVDGVPHHIIYYRSPLKIFRQVFKTVAYIKGFRLILKKIKTLDLIHAHVTIDAAFFAWMIGKVKNIPFVVTEHAPDYLEQNWHRISKFVKPLLKRVIKQSQYVLPVSHSLSNNMQAFGLKGDYEVVPNVVNTKLFSITKKTNEQFRFLHISAFQEVKNIKGIINAVKLLEEKRKDFKITIAGIGNLKQLQQYAKGKGVLELIDFKGRQSEQEVAELMSEHDVFVLFSNYENLPCVLIEAQASGLPAISTDVGGTSEIISDAELGILISPQAEDVLAEKMSWMIDHVGQFDKEKIRKNAVNKYSEYQIRNQLMDIYNKTLRSE